MIHFSTKRHLTAAALAALSILPSIATRHNGRDFNLANFRYQTDSPSVFHNRHAREAQRISDMVAFSPDLKRKAEEKNPDPIFSLPPSDITGNIDAPDGQLWYYTGSFEYIEIPPHDNVMFTDRIMQEYTFNIYSADMKLLGTIKDKVRYTDEEVRVPLCEITPVATRNFFNTDDAVEIIVSLGINRIEGGNNYYSYVYALNGEKDSEGFDVPIDCLDDLVGDVIEGPASADGSDNFFITFMTDVFDDIEEGASFWDYLLAQKANFTIYGKALDDKGPRVLFNYTLPLIQLPGDQESVPALISLRNGDEIVYSLSYYKEPFYNQYDDPMSEDMTMRQGNSLIIDLYKATEEKIEKYTSTEIAMELDPMVDSAGNPTCLFSYYSVGSLRYGGDFLFDAPGAQPGMPEYIITRGNYQVSTDAITNSYFTYNHDGSLKNTLCLYADGTLEMGNIDGFEPQQLFVTADAFGYLYNFVDIYSGKTVVEIPADYYYDDDSDSELLSASVARTPSSDSYEYVFELRYPLVDDDENDILRFIHIDKNGNFLHFDYMNMGKGVAYAQSYLSTQALAPHAYSTSDIPAYMALVKRGLEGSEVKTEQLMIAEAESEEYPEGNTLLLLGEGANGPLASIVPEFAQGDAPGRLFAYYYDSETSLYTLDVYHLPINEEYSGINGMETDDSGLKAEGSALVSAGEIKVFSLDGRLVAAGNGAVEFASLPAGVYIVKANGKTCKIAK